MRQEEHAPFFMWLAQAGLPQSRHVLDDGFPHTWHNPVMSGIASPQLQHALEKLLGPLERERLEALGLCVLALVFHI